ncbi:hypothetical protein THAOC_21557, partial [Thalassiosira oceanica]
MDLESTDNGTDRILWCWLGLKSVELEPVGGLDSASVTAPTTAESWTQPAESWTQPLNRPCS